MSLRFRRTMQIIPGLRLNLFEAAPAFHSDPQRAPLYSWDEGDESNGWHPRVWALLDHLQTVFHWTPLIAERVRSAAWALSSQRRRSAGNGRICEII